MRRMGASEADIELVVAQSGQADSTTPVDDDCEVHPDCWESVMFFLMVQTQWVYRSVTTAMGSWSVRAGLNYPGVESAARLSGLRRPQLAELFADLRVIELEVLRADAEAGGK